jgi:phage gpG-like protein
MGIKAEDEITKALSQFAEILHHEILRAFSYLGEDCVKRIRDRSGEESWFDQTGNLRSSIGYAVYEEGKTILASSFQQILQGSEGTNTGRKMIESLAKSYSETYALVVVAGMDYASAVEARDNKDVLASAELYARGKIQETMNKAAERALKKIGKL